MTYAIQYIETFSSIDQADKALLPLLQQEDCLGGRLLRGNRIQVFFAIVSDLPLHPELPDNCKFVIIPDSLLAVLDINPMKVQED